MCPFSNSFPITWKRSAHVSALDAFLLYSGKVSVLSKDSDTSRLVKLLLPGTDGKEKLARASKLLLVMISKCSGLYSLGHSLS